jgi:hypothetical protein
MMKQLTARYSLSTVFMLALCLVLAACGSSASGSSSTISVPTATPTLAPTPTPSPSPTPTISLATITGDGYTIGYPSGWTPKKTTISPASVLQILRDASGSTFLMVESASSTGAVSPAGSIQGALGSLGAQSKNFQMKNVPSTVTINGIQWNQGAATAQDPTTGTSGTIYVISTTYPGNAHKAISIMYAAATSEFDQVNAEDFQPMLLSFKFA